MEPVTVLHPQLFIREQFQGGSVNISVYLISDCTLHFSIALWFVRRQSPCYRALEIVVTLLLLLLLLYITLYKHLSATPAAVTIDLKQRLIDTWASVSQNVIDKAVGQ